MRSKGGMAVMMLRVTCKITKSRWLGVLTRRRGSRRSRERKMWH